MKDSVRKEKLIKTYTYGKNFLLMLHDFVLYIFVILLGVMFLYAGVWFWLISIFLFFAFIPLLVSLILFEKIDIFQDRIEIKQVLFGKQVLKIKDIKSVELNSTGFILFPLFRVKNNIFKKFYFVTSALSYKDCYELQEIVQDILNKEINNGNR